MDPDLAYDELSRRLARSEAALEEADRRERAWRESEASYRSLFERLGQGYCELRLLRDESGRAVDQRYLAFNPAFERLFGIPVAQAVGRTASEVFPDLEQWWHDAFDRILKRGEPDRIEYQVASLDRWFEVYAYPGGNDRLTVLYEDISDRKRAEQALRENEERQAFLLKLSDALRSLDDPDATADEACRLLVEELHASRAQYTVMIDDTPGEEMAEVRGESLRVGERMMRRFPMNAFGSALVDRLRSGRTGVVDDIADETSISRAQRDLHLNAGSPAHISVPRVRDGRLVATLTLHDLRPRAWTPREVSLVEEVAHRTWAAVERARAEAAQRAGEERFRQFADASAAGLWIRNADTLAMEFVSPAIATIYGVEPDAMLGDVKHWAAMIVPEDRDVAIRHLEAARRGEVAIHEFRIQRLSDHAFRWIRNTDFPLRDDGNIPRIGGIAEDITETRRLFDHQTVLLAELQHRVRNIMGMIRSITNRTAPGASDAEAYRALLEGRLLALARVQALLTREANAGGSLRSIIETEVAAQADHGDQFTLSGPDAKLSAKAVEVLTLAFHELATNALKYGALSVPEGRLSVAWTLIERRGKPWLVLDWVEIGAPPREPTGRRGFGHELIEARVPYELGGRGEVSLSPEGARCHLEFPLHDNESILNTDAPLPATVFGGSLDMTGAPDLTGRRVLVVEDDYYIAADTAAALRGAGATVLGPCPSEEAAHGLIEEEAPTHAVLDLNLGGGGPKFEVAHLLAERGVSFVFLTGYDPEVIPEAMRTVVRLQKPVPFRNIVEAVSAL